MKRLLPLILCLMLLATTACSGTAATTTTTAALPEPETKSTTTAAAAEPPLKESSDAVELTISASNISIKSDWSVAWGEDEISRMLMNLTDVKLVFQKGEEDDMYPSSMLDVIMASKEFPDLLFVTRSD